MGKTISHRLLHQRRRAVPLDGGSGKTFNAQATVWAITSAATITNEAEAVDTSLIPAWLQIWMPLEILEMFQALMASFGSMVHALLTTVPALGGIVTVLVWVVWGFGALAIVALAVGAKMLIALAKGQRFHKRSTAA